MRHRWRIIDTWNGGRGGRVTLFTSLSTGDQGHNECFKWVHVHRPYSFDEATKNQGLVVEPDLWFHGGPRIEDWDALRWERPRDLDQNEEGPGMYWSELRSDAESYVKDGVLYAAQLKPKFHFVPARGPMLSDLQFLWDEADREDKDIFLGDRDLPPVVTDDEVDRCLEEYLIGDLLVHALTGLYQDLFRRQPDKYVRALRRLRHDGAVIPKDTGVRHLVLWNPGAAYIEECT